jgi:hypothetical protein
MTTTYEVHAQILGTMRGPSHTGFKSMETAKAVARGLLNNSADTGIVVVTLVEKSASGERILWDNYEGVRLVDLDAKPQKGSAR